MCALCTQVCNYMCVCVYQAYADKCAHVCASAVHCVAARVQTWASCFTQVPSTLFSETQFLTGTWSFLRNPSASLSLV